MNGALLDMIETLTDVGEGLKQFRFYITEELRTAENNYNSFKSDGNTKMTEYWQGRMLGLKGVVSAFNEFVQSTL